MVEVGLIPAGAGNIYERESIDFERRAHPRGCGEHPVEKKEKP